MILRWLRQRIWRRRRLIFRFNDGSRVRSVDPIEVAMALHDHARYLPGHLKGAAEGDREAQQIAAAAACDVFGVRPLQPDGKSGLTVSERIELLMAFDLYLLTLKKNIGRSPTRRSSTGSTSANSLEPITSDTSASGSTGTERPSEPPKSSDSASPQLNPS